VQSTIRSESETYRLRQPGRVLSSRLVVLQVARRDGCTRLSRTSLYRWRDDQRSDGKDCPVPTTWLKCPARAKGTNVGDWANRMAEHGNGIMLIFCPHREQHIGASHFPIRRRNLIPSRPCALLFAEWRVQQKRNFAKRLTCLWSVERRGAAATQELLVHSTLKQKSCPASRHRCCSTSWRTGIYGGGEF
jgi:hypothetical protein